MPELLDEQDPTSTRSGGPRTSEGKKKSSLNAMTHGSCSKQLIVRDELPEDFDALHERWFSSYDVDEAGVSLLEQTILGEWYLKRAQRNYLAVEGRMSESDPNDWTGEQLHRLGLMQRYKTGAERSFYRSVATLERYRRTRVYEGLAMERAERQVAERQVAERQVKDRERREPDEEADEPELTAVEKHALKPKVPLRPALSQHVMVRVVDEKTVTTVSPSNEELLEQSKSAETPPERVFRKFSILPWTPSEYQWANHLPGSSNSRDQVMKFEEWVRVIETEKNIEGGHLGPAELEQEWVDWYQATFVDLEHAVWEEWEEDVWEEVEDEDGAGGGAELGREEGDGVDPDKR